MEEIEGKKFLVKIPDVVFSQILKSKEIGLIDIIPSNLEKNKKIPGALPKINIRLNKKYFSAHNFNLAFEPTDFFITFKDKKNKPSLVNKIDYFGRFIAMNDEVSDNVAKEITKRENDKIMGVHKIEEVDRRQQNLENLQDLKEKNEKSRIKKEQTQKKTRLPKEQLKLEIFELFSKCDHLTAKEIERKLEQPDNYLKEVLREICDYTGSGAYKGYYQLKSQFLKSNVNNTHDDGKEFLNEEDDDGI